MARGHLKRRLALGAVAAAVIAFIAAAALGAGSAAPPRDGSRVQVTVGGTKVLATVRASAAGRAQGLSGRPGLEPRHGMLFEFPAADTETFWMKGMRFPIDIVWIRARAVAGVTARVPAPPPGISQAELRVYPSPGRVDRVLEVPSGWAQAHGIGKGDPVSVRR